MAGARVRWRRSDEEFEVLDHGRMWFGDTTTIVAAAEVIEPASVTELRHAVDACRRDMGNGDYLFEVYDAPAEQLRTDEDLFVARPVSLEVPVPYTILGLVLALAPEDRTQEGHEVAAILSPLLSRMRATLLEFTVES